MFKPTNLFLLALLSGASVLPAARGGAILIINGASSTSEPGTTAQITSNLSALEIAAGNTVTVNNVTPASLAGFSQVWDIRFSNSSPITSTQQAAYVSYLQSGGNLFVMGENGSFPTRNASVLSLISILGGGNLPIVAKQFLINEIVQPPFTGPNPVSSVNFAAVSDFTSSGTGQFITKSSPSEGDGVFFGVGSLPGAPAGQLAAILDVNFLQGTINPPNDVNLTKNLIGTFDAPPPPASVPEPLSLVVWGVGVLGLAAVARRRRRTAA